MRKAFAIWAVLQSGAAFAAQDIGSAAIIRNQVEGTVSEQTESLASGSAVYANEMIRSGEASIAELVFHDDTKLSVGPRSEVRLDKFVFDPSQGAGPVVIRAGRGAYRFITGVQDHRAYEIKTPYATLGVRGTIVEMDVQPGEGPPLVLKAPPAAHKLPPGCEKGYEKVKLVEGGLLITTARGQTMVTEPNTVITICANGAFFQGQQVSSILPFTPESVAIAPTGTEIAAGMAVGAAIGISAIVVEEHPASP